MKIKTKEELSKFLLRNVRECPRVRRYNKSTKSMEHFWIVSVMPYDENSTLSQECCGEATFTLVKIVKYGYCPLRINVDFYTLISSFDFVQ